MVGLGWNRFLAAPNPASPSSSTLPSSSNEPYSTSGASLDSKLALSPSTSAGECGTSPNERKRARGWIPQRTGPPSSPSSGRVIAEGVFDTPDSHWLAVARVSETRLGEEARGGDDGEPASKKRRGIAGALIDLALFTTAVTYQLWKNAPPPNADVDLILQKRSRAGSSASIPTTPPPPYDAIPPSANRTPPPSRIPRSRPRPSLRRTSSSNSPDPFFKNYTLPEFTPLEEEADLCLELEQDAEMAVIAERLKSLIATGREALLSTPSLEEGDVGSHSPPSLPALIPQTVSRSRKHAPSPLRYSSAASSNAFPHFNASSPSPSFPTTNHHTPSFAPHSVGGSRGGVSPAARTLASSSLSRTLSSSSTPTSIQGAPSPLLSSRGSVAESTMLSVLERSENDRGKAWWEES